MNASSPAAPPKRIHRGRGAGSNLDGRFADTQREGFDDGWGESEQALPPLATEVSVDRARSIIARNESPDLPFSQSLNPYRGCEHGCVYCYARPTHAYYGLSPGLDFETRLAWKPEAPELLKQELAKRGYRCSPLALGVNTDAYQPLERRLGLTRRILEVLLACRHPLTLVTKSALIERDLDLLAALAGEKLVQVAFSVTTLEPALARRLEPRAASPARRLQAMRRLAEAGVPVALMCAPVIPGLNDHEIERILEAGRQAGARAAEWGLLRLPHEVDPLFRDWLEAHEPLKAKKIMALLRDSRGGKVYDADFATRMHGSGTYPELLARRFNLACKRLALGKPGRDLDCSRFVPPAEGGEQLSLF